ncbi:MAG: bifunctional helix-turn-helix domain-containing protein/methylated-DNA--[protein]-cysteine S-methyltransferase [Spirochaetia bacterium]
MSEPSGEWTRDYRRIERAIAFIEENRERRPDLAEVAGVAGVSEFHFQRLFSRMVGISPKKYEQFLTKEAAKKLLADSESLLDTALDLGLSEYKSRGAGLTISYGFHPSPFGEAFLAATPRGLCALYFADEGGRESARERLREEWANAKIVDDPEGTRGIAAAIFTPARRAKTPLTLYLRGTNFQVKVWEALLAIPPGRLTTYTSIARKIGDPNALRAVGSAVGRNPIAFLIPCHRVIRKTGELGGYHWGVARKRLILAWESEQAERVEQAAR